MMFEFLPTGSGGSEPQAKIADRMASVADEIGSVSFVLALGDNFYRYTFIHLTPPTHHLRINPNRLRPSRFPRRGVSSVDDPRFKTSYEDVYTHSSLQVPWYLIAGTKPLLRSMAWAFVCCV